MKAMQSQNENRKNGSNGLSKPGEKKVVDIFGAPIFETSVIYFDDLTQIFVSIPNVSAKNLLGEMALVGENTVRIGATVFPIHKSTALKN